MKDKNRGRRGHSKPSQYGKSNEERFHWLAAPQNTMLQELPGDFIRDRAALWKNNSPFALVSHSGPILPLKVVSVPRLEAKHEANHSEACRLCSPVRMPLCG